jgi:hypothetical protein
MTTIDAFISRAQEKTEGLRREIALLEAQEAGVRRRRLELEQEATDWQRAVELYAQAMAIEPPHMESTEHSKETVGDLITRYLREQPGTTAKVAAIAAWLAEVGRYPAGPDSANQNYSMAYNALLRNRDRFAKARPGEWRLIEAESTEG